ncbi:hypothetical protein MMC28_000343 [Mycoblastus sanguinarius]|nr:hypothetical protein [Mycoblastus sanguinarius]
MPIGIQRLNAPRPQPSSQIIFIKPLPGPTQAYAQDFLERIAAICHPVMKANHLSIMTLAEHEPNPEFIGRNFNAGEIIELVLKAPYSGHWLSFRSVQMVMMHELAHCKQMNHSGAFWKVNNQFKGELRELWAKGYSGDGLWGRGQTLLSGEYDTGRNIENEVLPRNLCGGTFRSSRGGKRKRIGGEKKQETYAERQQRRIAKKFGVNGCTLGDDTDTRVKLENGKQPKGKPRVAGSARGRELRAAAALARFGQNKDEEAKKEEDTNSESESESGYDDADAKNEAFDVDGSRLRDGQGRGMVKVCGDEDQDDTNVKREMEELHELGNDNRNIRPVEAPQQVKRPHDAHPNRSLWDIPQYVEKDEQPAPLQNGSKRPAPTVRAKKQAMTEPYRTLVAGPPDLSNSAPLITQMICPICSMANDPSALLCNACSHVLDTSKITKYWQCKSDACKGSQYVNAADYGLCGVCGARKVAADSD